MINKAIYASENVYVPCTLSVPSLNSSAVQLTESTEPPVIIVIFSWLVNCETKAVALAYASVQAPSSTVPDARIPSVELLVEAEFTVRIEVGSRSTPAIFLKAYFMVTKRKRIEVTKDQQKRMYVNGMQ
jgi:hypothetical protein